MHRYSRIIFIFFILVSISIKLYCSTLGYNYDLELYKLYGNIILNGENIYTQTNLFNNGPISAYLCAGVVWLQHLLGNDDIQFFHLIWVLFLSLIDVLIALTLYRTFKPLVGILFLINPVSILITGYHSHIDNLAILLGFWSWLLLVSSKNSNSKIIISAVFLGFSLVVKHLMIFFPLWIFFWNEKFSLKERIFYLIISYGIFILSFLPFIFDNGAYNSILNNVIGYSSQQGSSVMAHLINLIIPVEAINNALSWIPFFPGIRLFFFLIMLIGGYIVIKTKQEYAFYLYLIFLVSASTQIANQYLEIPIISCAVFYKKWELWLYSLSAGFFLLFISDYNVGKLLMYYDFGLGKPGLVKFQYHLLFQLILWIFLYFFIFYKLRYREIFKLQCFTQLFKNKQEKEINLY